MHGYLLFSVLTLSWTCLHRVASSVENLGFLTIGMCRVKCITTVSIEIDDNMETNYVDA